MAARSKSTPQWQQNAEYWALRLLVETIGILPRPLRRAVGMLLGWLAWTLTPRLRRIGLRNLELAFPEKSTGAREAILRRLYRHLGIQIGEFCGMRRWTRDSASRFIRYDGLNRYLAARDKGKGVLVLTGHLGAWELSSFYHSLMGYPMRMVVRRLDNARVNSFIEGIRSLHGNQALDKDEFARGLLAAMHRGETVGILMDTNMTPPQGVFVPFFGVDACTASGLARVALHSGAAVVPGFLAWSDAEQKYILHFGEELTLVRTGEREHDILANTALFTATLERYIRQYPDQWLWVHRRWKTRPEGGAPVYSSRSLDNSQPRLPVGKP